MTNMGACCVAALLLLSVPAWAGTTVRGVVVRNSEHGAPMAGVELTAPGANPVTTGNGGQFALVFREFAARAPATYQQRVQRVEQKLRELNAANP